MSEAYKRQLRSKVQAMAIVVEQFGRDAFDLDGANAEVIAEYHGRVHEVVNDLMGGLEKARNNKETGK